MMKVIEWTGKSVRFLDQTRLPGEEVVRETDDPAVLAEAIRSLAIRGAPLIGIAAAYGIALSVRTLTATEGRSLASHLARTIDLFASTRPTAVNLFWALDRMKKTSERESSLNGLQKALEQEAVAIHEEDRIMCDQIGSAGADLLSAGAAALTHCNTGMLATGGKGTALAVLHTAWERRKLRTVYIGETRPLFQGSRLTAWELSKLKIPATIVTDSTAGFLMQQGKVNVVVVGADRIAANGDIANKIGTYGLAVLAHHHQVPFYVAAPSSTIDFSTSAGRLIEIEQRSPLEVTTVGGTTIAAEGVEVYSPAFDVTPHELVTALITERGVLRPPYDTTLRSLEEPHSSGITA